MNVILDVIGSTVIGGFIILALLQLNIQMTSSSQELLLSNISQYSLEGFSEVIEHDIYKLGYGVENKSSEMLIVADSTSIKFTADLNNNGFVDTVTYQLSDVTAVDTNFLHPNTRTIKRKVNNGTPLIVGKVNKLIFSYYNSIGKKVEPKTASERMLVKYIQVYAKSSFGKVDGYFQEAEWQKKFRPKNTTNNI